MTDTTTDFYSECEDGLATLIRTKLAATFPNEWSVSDDDTVIARGGDVFLILRPGRFPYAAGSEGAEGVYSWEISADLFVRYVTYKTSWDRFKAVRSDLINLIHLYPNLNDTAGVLGVTVSSSEKTAYFKLDETAVKANFIIQTLSFTVKQWVVFAGGEL